MICNLIEEMDLTPKSFISAFISSSSSRMAFLQRYWGTSTGWPSTLLLLKTIRDAICNKPLGNDYWESFILEEVRTSLFPSFVSYNLLMLFFIFPVTKIRQPISQLLKSHAAALTHMEPITTQKTYPSLVSRLSQRRSKITFLPHETCPSYSI
jgi:hypothetical protein